MSTTHFEQSHTPLQTCGRTLHSFLGWLAWGALLLAPIVARFALAIPFLKSGLTKWSGWFTLSPVADFMLESMFQLHIFGHAYNFPLPDVLAHLDAVGEVVLPVLLMAGLATRLSALGILVMVGVIQLTVPAGWANFHLPWAGLALSIMALGPGKASIDYAIETWLAKRSKAPASG
jgi:putative oxidoreductase